MEFSHKTVLLREAVDALAVRPDGTYIDATAGGGGHSARILSLLSAADGGRLICIDRDPDAIAALKERFAGRGNVTVVHAVFSDIKAVLRDTGVRGANGVLCDLGVSSHQLDTAERGFSYHHDAPLDMRMSKDGESARDAVNSLSYEELRDVLYSYGEEKYAPSIARNIVREREKKPIETTLELAGIVSGSVPAKARRDSHAARKTFQALRIYVNRETETLAASLSDMFDCLEPSGRLAVISFHSLEDRIVKNSFAEKCRGCTCPPEFPVCVCGKKPAGKLVFRRVTPSEEELAENRRARSAVLRAIEKL